MASERVPTQAREVRRAKSTRILTMAIAAWMSR